MVGEESFYSGVSDLDHEALQLTIALAQDSAFRTPSVREIELADAVVVVGEDVTNTSPRIALALRQSVRNRAIDLAKGARIPAWQDAAVRELAQHDRSPLAILNPYATRLDDISSELVIGSPSELVAVAGAIANNISGKAPIVTSDDPRVEQIAKNLVGAKRPLIIAGGSAGCIDYIKAACLLYTSDAADE